MGNRRSLPDIVRIVFINAGIENVWKAISTSDGLANWLMPNTFYAELGHKFTMKASPRGDWDGTIECTVKELEPPRRLGFSWNGMGASFYITFTLSEDNDKTKLTLVHSGWYEGMEKDRETMYHGWGYMLEGLQNKEEAVKKDE